MSIALNDFEKDIPCYTLWNFTFCLRVLQRWQARLVLARLVILEKFGLLSMLLLR